MRSKRWMKLIAYREVVIRTIASPQAVRITNREENQSCCKKIARIINVIPTVTENTIFMNSRQKVRVALREYNPSSAKTIKKNGATTSTTFVYAFKGKSNNTGFISTTLGVNRTQ